MVTNRLHYRAYLFSFISSVCEREKNIAADCAASISLLTFQALEYII